MVQKNWAILPSSSEVKKVVGDLPHFIFKTKKLKQQLCYKEIVFIAVMSIVKALSVVIIVFIVVISIQILFLEVLLLNNHLFLIHLQNVSQKMLSSLLIV